MKKVMEVSEESCCIEYTENEVQFGKEVLLHKFGEIAIEGHPVPVITYKLILETEPGMITDKQFGIMLMINIDCSDKKDIDITSVPFQDRRAGSLLRFLEYVSQTPDHGGKESTMFKRFVMESIFNIPIQLGNKFGYNLKRHPTKFHGIQICVLSEINTGLYLIFIYDKYKNLISTNYPTVIRNITFQKGLTINIVAYTNFNTKKYDEEDVVIDIDPAIFKSEVFLPVSEASN